MMAHEECGTCRYYKDKSRPGELRSGYGECLRFPTPTKTNDGRWCGEYARDKEFET